MDERVQFIPPPVVGASPSGHLDERKEGRALVMVFSCVLQRLLKANLKGGVSNGEKKMNSCICDR